MLVLKTLKSIRMNGELIPPGKTIKVHDAQELVDKGFARTLSYSEIQNILDGYVREATKIFSINTEEKTIKPKTNKTTIRGRLL